LDKTKRICAYAQTTYTYFNEISETVLRNI